MRTFILTLDYELFGDGSGDIEALMIKPTERLLLLAEKYGIKYTFFFEVIEYWKFQEALEVGNLMGYSFNPVEAIKSQIHDIVRKGHDVQLHLHPQWLEAEYCGRTWKVDGSRWRLGDYRITQGMSLFDLIKKGKETLESLIKPVNPEYRCMAIRAGGYNAQPSFEIVRAMEACHIKVDSSLYAGGVEEGPLSRYDYSNIPDAQYWQVGRELTEHGNSSVIELPIYSAKISLWQKYTSLNLWLAYGRKLKYPRYAPLDCNIAQKGNKHRNWHEKIWQSWDFCLLSPRMQNVFLQRMVASGRNSAVLVGHPKSFTRRNGLERLLELTKYDKFITITDFLQSC